MLWMLCFVSPLDPHRVFQSVFQEEIQFPLTEQDYSVFVLRHYGVFIVGCFQILGFVRETLTQLECSMSRFKLRRDIVFHSSLTALFQQLSLFLQEYLDFQEQGTNNPLHRILLLLDLIHKLLVERIQMIFCCQYRDYSVFFWNSK